MSKDGEYAPFPAKLSPAYTRIFRIEANSTASVNDVMSLACSIESHADGPPGVRLGLTQGQSSRLWSTVIQARLIGGTEAAIFHRAS